MGGLPGKLRRETGLAVEQGGGEGGIRIQSERLARETSGGFVIAELVFVVFS